MVYDNPYTSLDVSISSLKPHWPYVDQIVINHIETAYSDINNAITMAVTLRKPVFIGIASNLATAKHPSLATEPFAFS